jgi:hypothetical protein
MFIASNAVPAAITQVDARTAGKFTTSPAIPGYSEFGGELRL